MLQSLISGGGPYFQLTGPNNTFRLNRAIRELDEGFASVISFYGSVRSVLGSRSLQVQGGAVGPSSGYDMLARNRLNTLDLHGAYDRANTRFYNLLPMLVHLDDYPRAGDQQTQEKNLGAFKRLLAHAEKRGTFTSTKGRVQKFMKAIEPPGGARPEWEFLGEFLTKLSGQDGVVSIEGLFNQMAAEVPAFQGLTWGSLGDNGVTVSI